MISPEPYIFTTFQNKVLELVDTFLNASFQQLQSRKEQLKDADNLTIAREVNSLELLLPRQFGSTLLTHVLCHDHNCLVVTHGFDAAQIFRNQHAEMFPDEKPAVTPIHLLKKEQNLLVADFEHLKMISEALTRSTVVVFDVYRAFDQNSAVRKLMKEVGRTHRFVFFR